MQAFRAFLVPGIRSAALGERKREKRQFRAVLPAFAAVLALELERGDDHRQVAARQFAGWERHQRFAEIVCVEGGEGEYRRATCPCRSTTDERSERPQSRGSGGG